MSSGTEDNGVPNASSPAMIRRVALASCIGSTVEWYDFFIYATAAALVFNKLFFPQFDPLVGSLVALGTYAAGFIARPIGGLVFGYIGDRFGRKKALVTTLLIVGIATFVIGLMPTYGTIGITAPIILICIRMLHGFGIGGEQGNAILITCEHAPAEQRGFYGSLVQIGAPAGFVLPLALFALLTVTISDESFIEWGWRIPFLLSILLIGIGLYIRLHLSESPLFAAAHREKRVHVPMTTMLKKHTRDVLLGWGAKLSESTIFSVYAVMISAYAVSRGIPKSVMTASILVAILVELVTLPLFGALSDRIGRRKVYILGAVITLLLAFPMFGLVYYDQQGLIWLGLIGALAVGHSAMYAPQAAFFAELFPVSVRATGVAIVQQFGALIGTIGGFGAGWLLKVGDGTPWLLAGYVAFTAAVTAVSVFIMRETAVLKTQPADVMAEAAGE
ncbi:MFS transporter [Telmatospirillum sp.]|uniref:MFS transporter n=1 Tax=Telmatospirillum sp. TaxID=2079197 RepID=UPI002847D6ED|nr:MFS transporter [Telmatospirillum sp.]MDR3438290.1 MFS transporter [Telmatospirillum sp.]